jgi:hypothetical protein
MPQAKFGTGQRVTYSRPTLITPDEDYTIMRVFPREALDQRYAIKCAHEPYERVVRENDIRLRADAARARRSQLDAAKAVG